MAISNSNKPHSLPPLAFFITIFLFLLNRVHSKSDETFFVFKNFDKDQENLILKGSAATNPENHDLQLSYLYPDSPKPQISQAIYSAPFHLWESPSNVASFDTNFTYYTESQPGNSELLDDGFTFFISSLNISSGEPDGLFGLFHEREQEVMSDKIVAIEFDTFINTRLGDPSYKHIGINVNSIQSKKTVNWGWSNGRDGVARINYNPSSKILSVSSYYDDAHHVSFSYEIELSKILPEYVQVGFSASTGKYSERSGIYSWSFASNLKLKNVKKANEYVAN